MAQGIDWEAIKPIFLPYLERLKNFEFSYNNPLFWIILVLLFLILTRLWDRRKAFSYCVILAITLLITTGLEVITRKILYTPGETLDTSIIKYISIFILIIVTLFYAFVKL